MAYTYHTIVWGETLSGIAQKYGTTVSTLQKWNNIPNANLIIAGDKIIVKKGSGDKDPPAAQAKSTNQITFLQFGLQNGSDRTIFATWKWPKDHTKEYKVIWYYYTGNDVGFIGSETTTTHRQTLYQAPSNAKSVAVIIKPISTTYKSDKKDVHHWTAEWSTKKKYTFPADKPETPSTPTVEMDGSKMTATLDNLNVNANWIRFQFVKNNKDVYKTANVKILTGHVAYSITVPDGVDMKVRARAQSSETYPSRYSEWSDYSSNYRSKPSKPKEITSLKAKTETSVELKWSTVATAEHYEIEYADDQSLFNVTSSTTIEPTDRATNVWDITGLETGKKWFFRVRAVNDSGNSSWTSIKSITLGEAPDAPTTWSSTTTAFVGEDVTLYWVHNTKDGSNLVKSRIELDVDGEISYVTVENEDEDSNTGTYKLQELAEVQDRSGLNLRSGPSMSYEILKTVGYHKVVELRGPMDEHGWVKVRYTDNNDNRTTGYMCAIDSTGHQHLLSEFLEGAQIKWRVKTRGILSTYGPYSTALKIDVYAKPTMELYLLDGESDESIEHRIEDINAYPFYICADVGPESQTPIGYTIVMTAMTEYDVDDETGTYQHINIDDVVYSKTINTRNNLKHKMTPTSAQLKNNEQYELTVTATMNTGLTVTDSLIPACFFDDVDYAPNATVTINKNKLTAAIRPTCESLTGVITHFAYFHEEPSSSSEVLATLNVDDHVIMNGEVTNGYRAVIYDGIEGYVYGSYVSFEEVNVKLSVYRKTMSGEFVEIASNIDGAKRVTVTDMHPALDYARYRIVSQSKLTGKYDYYDVPPEYVGETSIILQWDDYWAATEEESEDEYEKKPAGTSMVKLPYNIELDESVSKDVEEIEYIGREHPVTYYGTQRGESMSLKAEIPRDDTETLASLRRLNRWMGDVYVREPNGNGYWANVNVSFNKSYNSLTIPITVDAVRVEGGE